MYRLAVGERPATLRRRGGRQTRPHGGVEYIAGLLGCDPKTIRRGQQDLEDLQAQPLQDIVPSERVRKKGVEANPS